MAGASGGGPAAWAAAAFGRGEERKVFKHYPIFVTYNIHIFLQIVSLKIYLNYFFQLLGTYRALRLCYRVVLPISGISARNTQYR